MVAIDADGVEGMERGRALNSSCCCCSIKTKALVVMAARLAASVTQASSPVGGQSGTGILPVTFAAGEPHFPSTVWEKVCSANPESLGRLRRFF